MDFISVKTDGGSIFLIEKEKSNESSIVISVYCSKTNMLGHYVMTKKSSLKNAVKNYGIYEVGYDRASVRVINNESDHVDFLIKSVEPWFIKVSVDKKELTDALNGLSVK